MLHLEPSPAEPDVTEVLRAALTALLSDLDGLMSDSYGVAGLLLNGDVAPWHSLTSGGQFEDWLSSIDTARAALALAGAAQ